MIDVIGDIHGYAEHAECLLKKMGYRKDSSGAYRHPERTALFLGDLVDRGPQQVETVYLVRRMVDAGSAKVIMGNHELNAVAWATPHPDQPNQHLRAHTGRNRAPHQSFLDQVGEGSALHQEIIAWFKTIPLLYDGDIKAIHACWDTASIETLKPFLNPDMSLRGDAWLPTHTKGSTEYEALELLLKGPEVELPQGLNYTDKDGIVRTRSRTRWWDTHAINYADVALVPKELRPHMPQTPVPDSDRIVYAGETPLFVGHYWMKGAPEILSDYVACIDYSIGKGAHDAKMCGYRWSGEKELSNANFSWVGFDLERKRDREAGHFTP